MSYLAYENTMFWQRSGFFLVSSAALSAIASAQLPALRTPHEEDVIVPLAISLFGLAITVLWMKALEAASSWIDHWHGVLEDLAKTAMPGYRFGPDKPTGLKRLARRVVWLVRLLWLSIIAYCVCLVGFGPA